MSLFIAAQPFSSQKIMKIIYYFFYLDPMREPQTSEVFFPGRVVCVSVRHAFWEKRCLVAQEGSEWTRTPLRPATWPPQTHKPHLG